MGLFRRSKNTKTPLLGQILNLIPRHLLQNQIDKHQSDKGCSKYKTYDQFVALTFGQLNKCYSLSVISCGLSVSSTFLTDIGLQQSPAKSTMGTGNKNRTYKVFEGLYFRLLSHYKHVLKSHYQSHIIEEIKHHSIKLIDSTTISLCLSLFDWAKFRTSENAVKSQIYVALSTYLLLELIRRCCTDTNAAFSNFCEKIKICLMHYLTIDYLCNELKPIVKKAKKPPDKNLFNRDNFSKQLYLSL